METQNKLFSVKRFSAYSKFNWLLNWKQYIMMPLVAGFVLFAILLFSILDSRSWRVNDWQVSLLMFFTILGSLFIGSAFPFLRKKEGVLAFNLLPVSNFEKYTYEFLVRFVGFIVIFPLLASVFGNLAIVVVRGLNVFNHPEVDVKYALLTWSDLFLKKENSMLIMVFSVLFFGFSLVFAGTVVFLKNPLVKTVLFVGVVAGIIAYYFYFVFGIFKYNGTPFFVPLVKNWNDDIALVVAASFMFCMSLLVQAFTFFKLKEKEV